MYFIWILQRQTSLTATCILSGSYNKWQTKFTATCILSGSYKGKHHLQLHVFYLDLTMANIIYSYMYFIWILQRQTSFTATCILSGSYNGKLHLQLHVFFSGSYNSKHHLQLHVFYLDLTMANIIYSYMYFIWILQRQSSFTATCILSGSYNGKHHLQLHVFYLDLTTANIIYSYMYFILDHIWIFSDKHHYSYFIWLLQ